MSSIDALEQIADELQSRNHTTPEHPPLCAAGRVMADVLEHVTFQGVSVHYRHDKFADEAECMLRVHLQARVWDRDTASYQVKVAAQGLFSCGMLQEGDDAVARHMVLHALRRQLVSMLEHELDEHLRYRGAYVREPHPVTGRTDEPPLPSGRLLAALLPQRR